MKTIFLSITFSLSVLASIAQRKPPSDPPPGIEKTSCITVGILQGGGSLIGVDFEQLITKRVGVQVGAGAVGFGAAINFHLKPSVQSSFFSLSYIHQGIGASYIQSALGPTFVYRARRGFTFQIGVGKVLETSKTFRDSYYNGRQPEVIALYSIGWSFAI